MEPLFTSEKRKTSQINNGSIHFKIREKDFTKPKARGRKEIIKMGAENNEVENRKTLEKISITKSWFSKKITKTW